MTDDNATMKARELLRSGQLPAHYPERVLGGRGSGHNRCLLCGDLISRNQMGMEAEFCDALASRSFYFHGRCFRALEPEWRRFYLTSIVREQLPPAAEAERKP